MRRKPGVILPIELAILEAAVDLMRRGTAEFYGFQIAKEIKERQEASRLTSHGTLYKALGRMEDAGLLASRWEDPMRAAEEGRPRRRWYRVTAQGEAAVAQAGAREPVAQLKEQTAAS